MAQFAIENLTFSYPTDPEHPSLQEISLQVEQGEYIALCGKSGSGKTTLLRHLKTVLTPHGNRTGSIFYEGAPLDKADLRKQSSEIGFVMQNPDSQIVTDKVWHELAFSCESVGMERNEIRRRVGEMAGYFGLEELFDKPTDMLSGGQKQLLCLASAAVLHPELLLLDEQTSQLDPIAAQNFIDAVRRLNRDFGVTVIAAEHRLEELLPISDRAVVMDGGRIIADCAPALLADSLPAGHPMEKALTASQRVFRAAGGRGASPVSVREGRSSAVCREYLTEHAQKAGKQYVPSGEPLVSVKELCAGWGRNAPDVLRGASLRIFPGEIYAVIGGNGSGKSTLLKVICGMLRQTSGRVKLRRGLVPVYLPQNPCMLFTQDTAGQEAPAEYLERFGLAELSGRDPLDLSGGERQRLALAKLLSGKPELLLLDEPTKGMDAASKQELSGLLRSVAADGCAVLLVTHDTELAADCADMCGMLFNGEILNEASPEEMFRENYFYTTPMARLIRGISENK